MKKPVCTVILVMINVAVFLVLSFLGMTEDGGFMVEHGAMFVPYVTEYKEYYRIFTSMFLHFGSGPLMNNMIMLTAAGVPLEKEVGRVKFLAAPCYLCGRISAPASMRWRRARQGPSSGLLEQCSISP